MTEKSQKTLILLIGVLALTLAMSYFVLAWTEPSAPPPTTIVPAPINVGSTAQTKAGDLGIGTGLSYWITQSGDSFALKNNANTITFLLGQDGNVGLGTITPSARLDLVTSPSSLAANQTTTEINAGGTFDTTAAPRYNYGIYTIANASRIAGANYLYNYGLYSRAYNAQYNFGGYGYAYGGTASYGNYGYASGANTTYGVYGLASGSTGTKYGLYGYASGAGTNYAIYGSASGGTTNWGLYVNAGNTYLPANVGIATTTLTYPLNVKGDIYSSGYVRGGTGLCISADCKTSWPPGGAGEAYWLLSGSNLYTSSTAWNVGIGTTGPGNKLGITITANDAIPALGSNGGSFGIFKYDDGPPAAGDYGFIMGVHGSGNVWQQVQRIDGTATAYNLLLQPNGGFVGIGTTSPTETLDVNGSIKIPSANAVDNGSPGIIAVSDDDFLYDGEYLNHYGYGFHAYNDGGGLGPNAYISGYYGIDLFAGGAERLRINSNGFVGIGTTAPKAPLHVSQSGVGYSHIRITNTSASAGKTNFITAGDAGNLDNSLIFGIDEGSGTSGMGGGSLISAFALQRTAANTVKVYTTAANSGIRNVLDDGSGKVGIGISNPAYKLDVDGTIHGKHTGSGTAVYGESTGLNGTGVTGYATANDSWGIKGYAEGGNSRGVKGWASGSSGYGVEAYSGQSIGVYSFGATYDFYADGPGVNYGAPSSIRWKENIKPIDNALNKVLSLRGVYFDWNGEHGGKHDIGMIGEEVGKVLPEIVAYETDGSGYTSGMDYGKLTPLLVEALKELKAENDALKQRIETLENKVKY